MDALMEDVMRRYMKFLLEQMEKPETPLLEINDGIRLITIHFAKIRNIATRKDQSDR